MTKNNIYSGFAFLIIFGVLILLTGCLQSPDEKTPADNVNRSTPSISRTEDNKTTDNGTTNMQNSPENKNDIETDIDELAKNINLPVRPSEAIWKKTKKDNEQGRIPGPNDYYLIAVLKYSDSEIEDLKEKTGQNKEEFTRGIDELQDWFPEEVKKLAKDIDGENLLPIEKYDAGAFVKSPYSKGTLSRVEGSNYFVLNLFSS